MTISNRMWRHLAGWWEQSSFGVLRGKAFSSTAAHPATNWRGSRREPRSQASGQPEGDGASCEPQILAQRSPIAPRAVGSAQPSRALAAGWEETGGTWGNQRFAVNSAIRGLHCGRTQTQRRGEKFEAVLLSLTFTALASSSARLSQPLPGGNVRSCLPLCRGGGGELKCRAAKHCCSALLWVGFLFFSDSPLPAFLEQGEHVCCGFFLFYQRMRCWLKTEEMALEELMQRLNAVSQCAGRRSCWS